MYMPPEWHPHRACLIIYPHNTQVFRSILTCDDEEDDDNDADAAVTTTNIATNSDGKKNNETTTNSIIVRPNKPTTKYCAPARSEVRNVARAIRDYGGEDVILFCNTLTDAIELERTLKHEEEDCDDDGGGGGGGGGDVDEVGWSNNQRRRRKNEIIVKVCPSDDSWCRDTGPTFVYSSSPRAEKTMETTTMRQHRQRQLTGFDWKFNAYGGPDHGCYWPCTNDQAVAMNVVSILNQQYYPSSIPTNNQSDINNDNDNDIIQHQPIDLILEGGSFHTDGDGTILTTEECLLHTNRNPSLTKLDIETILLRHLGATKVIWLPLGLACDDDTNGHVDNIATFVRPGEVLLSWTEEEDLEGEEGGNYGRCRAAEEVLRREVDGKGRAIIIHKLFIPRPMFYTEEEVKGLSIIPNDNDNNTDTDVQTITTTTTNITKEDEKVQACERMTRQRLAASYVNYYLANDAVILPQFGDIEYDAKARETMEEIFPDLDVVGVYSREILLGGGNIHCITQQVPI